MNLKYLITNKEDFESLLEYIRHEEIFGLDTETNGKWSQFELNLVGISLGFDLFSCYIPLTHFKGEQLSLQYVLEKLKPILEDPNTNYVCHNTKFDEKVFKIYGIECQGSGDDTYVLSWLLNEEHAKGTHGLKYLVRETLGITMETYEDVIDRGPKRRGAARDYNFAAVSIEDALSYAADDAYYTLRLYRVFRDQVEREGLWNAYVNIERPLLRIVRDMELNGLLVDKKYLAYAEEKYPEIMEAIEVEVYEEAGTSFNIDSGAQLGPILFEHLDIGKGKAEKTKTGRYSTDKKTLEKYSRHKIVEKILRRKRVKKTYDVFVAGLGPHIQPDGRVHAEFNSCGTVTGRFSSNKPNLQQIQGDEIETIKVRDFFIPSEGNVFVVGDFGQIELRVMAHFARDETAIAAFASGRDFHTETARGMFNIPEGQEPTARNRFNAKGINFGVPYGRGSYSVAEVLKLDRIDCRGDECGDCAQCYIDKWYENFPRVGPYKKVFLQKARKNTYMRTISGRKRRLPHLRSSESKLRYGAERQAFNCLCQGSAADIIKLGMVQVADKLPPLGAKILIQVHDELVVECPKENAQKVVEVLKETMEYPLNGQNPLRLPLNFEPKIVERWSQAK